MARFFSSFSKALLISLSIGALLFSSGISVYAQDIGEGKNPAAEEPAATPKVGEASQVVKPSSFYSGIFSKNQDRVTLDSLTSTVIPRFATYFASFLAGIAVLLLMYAGIQFMTAGGDPDKVSQATKTATFTLLGIVVAMFAYAIVYLFISIFTPS